MGHRNDGSFPTRLGSAGSPAQRKLLCDRASQIRSSRELRRRWFDRNMFGEPAWDILLALYVIDSDQRRLSTRQIALLANQPLTTALRWLDYLEQQDLVVRRSNPFDQRVIYVELSALGRATMDGYLMQMNETDMFAPMAVGER